MYPKRIDRGEGATFLAVLRGKISEGLDFKDNYGRAVVVVGIPYSVLDQRTQLKMKALDKKANYSKMRRLSLTGELWYQQEAIRAVNQSIGRVIRHKGDYGAIVLIDERYNDLSHRILLSKWLHPAFNSESYEIFLQKLQNFFEINKSEKEAIERNETSCISFNL